MDDVDADGNDIVEKVRILAHKPEDRVLVAIKSRRYPGEIASGNRTVRLQSLRPTEQASPVSPPKPSGRTKGRRR
ncbi:hypothetical protein ADT71_19875 [Novosphingobium sp. ST904]|nr:hypothetical protein ADT71_19875 [Novosphingobium sp. ST904]